MKITSTVRPLYFKAQDGDVNFDASAKNKKEKKYVDPLANWPMRGLGYTNDIGVAINEIAPTAARLFWVPALMYFGADVYDKYKNKGNKYDPDAKRAFSQAVFQAFASIILPTVFGHMGQSGFSQLEKYKGEKISTNAKEQTYRFIIGHASEHDIFGQHNKDKVIKNFEDSFNIFYTNNKKHYEKQNIFVKIYDKTLANCKKGAIANSNEKRIKEFAQKQFTEILNTCSDSEALKQFADKKIFKLKAWKSLGAFTALLLTVKPIDSFVESVIIKKVVEPQMEKLYFQHHKPISDFGKYNAEQNKNKEEKIMNS